MKVWGPWRRSRLVAGAVLAGVLIGLAIPLPRPARSTSTSPSPAPKRSTRAVFFAYFVDRRQGTLEPQAVLAPRPLPPQEGAALAFQSLCRGPTQEMVRLGIGSAVPASCRIHGVTLQGSRLILNASPGFYQPPAGQEAIWRDQVEMVAAQVPGVTQVELRADGKPLSPEALRRLGLSGPLPVDRRPGQLRLRQDPGAQTTARGGTKPTAGPYRPAEPIT